LHAAARLQPVPSHTAKQRPVSPLSELLSLCRRPITADAGTSLDGIISILLKNDISRVVVTEEGSPAGIITEKDIGLFLLSDDSERNLADIPASGLVNPLASVHASASIEKCAETMLEKNIGSLVVLSAANETAGIITKTDLAGYYSKNYSGRHAVGDLMTASFVEADSNASLGDAVQKMISEKVSRIFLKNPDGEPEGILTFRDLFRVALQQGNSDAVLDNSDPVISVVFTRKGFLSESGFGGTVLAKDVMTKSVESVDFEDDLAVACDIMSQSRINGVGVRIKGGFAGVVSKTDVLKAIHVENSPK